MIGDEIWTMNSKCKPCTAFDNIISAGFILIDVHQETQTLVWWSNEIIFFLINIQVESETSSYQWVFWMKLCIFIWWIYFDGLTVLTAFLIFLLELLCVVYEHGVCLFLFYSLLSYRKDRPNCQLYHKE